MSGRESGLENGICFFFFQAEDGIRDFCLSRGLGDVCRRQSLGSADSACSVIDLTEPELVEFKAACAEMFFLLWNMNITVVLMLPKNNQN